MKKKEEEAKEETRRVAYAIASENRRREIRRAAQESRGLLSKRCRAKFPPVSKRPAAESLTTVPKSALQKKLALNKARRQNILQKLTQKQ